MSIVVFYITKPPKHHAEYEYFTDSQLGEALKFAETMRKDGMRHVTISSEMSDNVGKMGVSEIVDGKLDDGTPYEWSKAGRAGKIKRSERAAWDAEKDV